MNNLVGVTGNIGGKDIQYWDDIRKSFRKYLDQDLIFPSTNSYDTL